ncbi:MAG: hypothetical protein GY710_05875 [Desulfobacteraceae bacterium]|nr:hypothetical protein [Desulfobacteraceae bacterium]
MNQDFNLADDILSAPNPTEENHIKAAAKTKTKKMPEIGRPKKPKDEKLSRKITVNLTEAEYQKVLGLSKKHFDVPLGKILRKLLKDQKVF